MCDQTQINLWTQAAEQALDACTRQTCLIQLSKRTNVVPRAHVSFGQRQETALTKRHVGSGKEIANEQNRRTK